MQCHRILRLDRPKPMQYLNCSKFDLSEPIILFYSISIENAKLAQTWTESAIYSEEYHVKAAIACKFSLTFPKLD